MNGTPRVLLHAFSTFNLGGPQARFVALANSFGPRYRHVITAMDNCYVAGDRLNADVTWEPLSLDVKKGGALANRQLFREVLRAQRPNLLLSYNWGAIEWAAGNLPGCVSQVHVEDGFGPEESARQLRRRVWMRRLLLAARGTPTIVASRHLERIALNRWWMRPDRVRFIANGVSVPARSAPTNESPSRQRRFLTIGTVAGLRPEKNIARLLKAFAAVRAKQDARLVIVGDGPERQLLERLANDLAISEDVEFTGYLKNPAERLQSFDLFALPSNTEQLPISLLEAMAVGMPVVATRVGDVADIIPSEAETCIAEPDDTSFRETLLRVIERQDIWPALIRAGRERVQRDFSPNSMLQEWQRIFDGEWRQIFSRSISGQRSKS